MLMFLCLIIYCVSVHGVYKTVKYLHEKGRFQGTEPLFIDTVMMVLPVFNTIYWMSNSFLISCDNKKVEDEPSFASRVFGIKKVG